MLDMPYDGPLITDGKLGCAEGIKFLLIDSVPLRAETTSTVENAEELDEVLPTVGVGALELLEEDGIVVCGEEVLDRYGSNPGIALDSVGVTGIADICDTLCGVADESSPAKNCFRVLGVMSGAEGSDESGGGTVISSSLVSAETLIVRPSNRATAEPPTVLPEELAELLVAGLNG